MDADALRRKRRTQYLIIAAFAAIAVVVALVVISQSGGGDDDGSAASAGGNARVSAELEGNPQSGTMLGDPSATVRVIEYGDLQCPVCRAFAAQVVPQLISGQVRPGNAAYEYRSWNIIGPDSKVASKAALAAGEQDRFFNFIQTFYAEQGAENSGYVTDAFLQQIAREAGVPDLGQWNRDRQDPRWDAVLEKNNADAESLGFTGTPSILVTGPKGQQPLSGFGLSEIEAAIQQVS